MRDRALARLGSGLTKSRCKQQLFSPNPSQATIASPEGGRLLAHGRKPWVFGDRFRFPALPRAPLAGRLGWMARVLPALARWARSLPPSGLANRFCPPRRGVTRKG